MGPCVRRDDGIARYALLSPTLFPEVSHFLIACELPALGLSETFKHGGAMGLGHNERIAPGGSNLLQHFRDIGLPIFRELAHLFNGVFENLGH
jgi:hypothetical protein